MKDSRTRAERLMSDSLHVTDSSGAFDGERLDAYAAAVCLFLCNGLSYMALSLRSFERRGLGATQAVLGSSFRARCLAGTAMPDQKYDYARVKMP